jgi:hypothetical protein
VSENQWLRCLLLLKNFEMTARAANTESVEAKARTLSAFLTLSETQHLAHI